MRRRVPFVVVLILVVSLAAVVAACGDSGSTTPSESPTAAASPSAASQTIKVDSAQVPAVVHLRVGDTLKVRLHSNTASTGYEWTAEGMEQEAVLKQIGDAKLIAPENGMPGAPGKTEFTFEAAEEGTEQLGFWYSPPSDPGNPGAAYALVVKVGKGHVPVEVKAGDEYTAETAEIRTGDTLQVVIKHAHSQGKASWKVAGASPGLELVGQQHSEGTATLDFKGVGSGATTLVLVNRPSGDPPLQTYALPVYVKAVKQPTTIHVNHHDNGESFKAKAGDSVKLILPAQPSTGYKWVMKKPDVNVLKQVGKARFTATNETLGSKGKMLWTFSVVGAGEAQVRALLEGPDAGSTGPAKEFSFTVVAKPGFKPRVVQAVDAYPAATQHVKPGDEVKVELASKGDTWVPQGTSKQLTHGKPVRSGGRTIVTYTARNKGIATPVLLAEASGGWPAQAYAFSAVVGKGAIPKTVTAVEHQVDKTIQMANGETFAVELPGNPDSGYAWAVSPLAKDGVIEQVGSVSFAASTDLMGSPGTFTAQFRAVGAGSVPLIMLYAPPATSDVAPDGIWMTMVTVK